MHRYLIILASLLVVLSACEKGNKVSTHAQSDPFEIKRGVNVSHWLSQTQIRGKEREMYVLEKDFAKIADLGFDHVRIPFDEEQMWDKNGQKHKDAFQLLHQAIKWSINHNLNVIIDLHILRSHHFNTDNKRLWTDPAAQEEFFGFWVQLSEEFKSYPVDKLAYELLNEAVADDPDDWNKLVNKGIETVRSLEPNRKIIVGSNRWQQVYTFKDLKIPENDKNLILSFHFYEPFILTHYKTSWTGILQNYSGPVNYPGLTVDTSEYENMSEELQERIRQSNVHWDVQKIEDAFTLAKNVATRYGLPLYCGEFGCFPSTPVELRKTYYQDMIAVFNKLDISWTHWNYKNDFPVVDETTLDPIEPILDALMGK